MNTTKLRLLAVPAVVLGLSFGVAACGDDSDDSGDAGAVTATDVWIRKPAEGQPNSAGYGTITNETGGDITLIGASADIQATFEIHETVADDEGVMSMQEREDGFTIGDGESFTLEPGGPHVMMLGIDPAEFEGEGFDLTFVFDGADDVTEFAEIRMVEGMGEMEGDMDDSDMDDGEMEGDMDDSEMEMDSEE